MKSMWVESAKLMAKGQITLPKDMRAALGVATGDRLTLIQQENQVIIMNSAVYAMRFLQQAMAGEAEKAQMASEEAVEAVLEELRKG